MQRLLKHVKQDCYKHDVNNEWGWHELDAFNTFGVWQFIHYIPATYLRALHRIKTFRHAIYEKTTMYPSTSPEYRPSSDSNLLISLINPITQDPPTGGWVGEWVGGWLGGWLGEWVSEWVCGWLGGWVGGWVGGWLGGLSGMLLKAR